MTKPKGAGRLVLQAVRDLPKDSAGFVTDLQVAQSTQIAVTDVRDCFETLEGDAYLEVARTIVGLRASVTAQGKLVLKQFQTVEATASGQNPPSESRQAVSPMPPLARQWAETLRSLGNPKTAGVLAVATMLALTAGVYLQGRLSEVGPIPGLSPVMLLVPTDRLFSGFAEPVRLELILEGGVSPAKWTIPRYEGTPLLVGTSKPLAVPREARTKYQCFRDFEEPELFPNPPARLEAGMRIRVELYYLDSGSPPKRYQSPPDVFAVEPLVDQKGSIQVEELHGP
jgi:hypothetical protein